MPNVSSPPGREHLAHRGRDQRTDVGRHGPQEPVDGPQPVVGATERARHGRDDDEEREQRQQRQIG